VVEVEVVCVCVCVSLLYSGWYGDQRSLPSAYSTTGEGTKCDNVGDESKSDAIIVRQHVSATLSPAGDARPLVPTVPTCTPWF